MKRERKNERDVSAVNAIISILNNECSLCTNLYVHAILFTYNFAFHSDALSIDGS